MCLSKYRSSHKRCCVKTGILKNFANFTGKHLCWSLFSPFFFLRTWLSLADVFIFILFYSLKPFKKLLYLHLLFKVFSEGKIIYCTKYFCRILIQSQQPFSSKINPPFLAFTCPPFQTKFQRVHPPFANNSSQ